MKYITWLFLIFASMNTKALDCEFIPKASFCGVSISGSPDIFFEKIGKPSSEIKLLGDRHGYFYIDRAKQVVVMLIFKGNSLNEIRSWEQNPNIDFWSFLEPTQPIDVRLQGETIIGMPAKAIAQKFGKYMVPGGSDQFGDTVVLKGTEISFTYLPFYGKSSYSLDNLNEYAKYTCSNVTFSQINP